MDVVDVVVQIHMVEIALFLYNDKTTVVGQPLVNHRPLFVSNMNSKDFLDRMQSKKHDFGEEMHATVYEVRKRIDNEDDPTAVPVYSAYVTREDYPTGHELNDIKAVYPSVEGLKKLVSTVGLQIDVNDNKPQTIIDIIKQVAKTCNFARDIFTKKERFGTDPAYLKPNNTTQMQTRFKAIQSQLQNQPIRFGMLGGLQRCGLTAHLLGNKTIHNKPPHEAKKGVYKFTAESSLRVLSPLHVILPQEREFNTNYILECAEYSKGIQDRKKDGFQTTIKAQLYDILAGTTDDTSQDINPMRMIDKTYWLDREVSAFHTGKIQCKYIFPISSHNNPRNCISRSL